ncbi:MAG: hypothetical protein OJF60_000840 [Burkholderiaceae bacterium]|jgi:hypothetical protein|nr:MAG: hypothetical protein OJF60_000840 [Burkholderiaceae bacterium]
MARHFLIVWIVYWLAVALMPVHSIYPATGPAFVLQLVFVLLTLAAFAVTHAYLGCPPRLPAGRFDLRAAPQLARLALVMSLIGLLCVLYDKIVVQGIDFSQGIVAAREQWRRLGEERDGAASSVFSVLGYLLGSGYFVAAVLAATQIRTMTVRQRLRTLLAAAVLLLVGSAISGGRSSVLLLAAMVLGGTAARGSLSLRELFPRRRQRRALMVVALVAAGYTVNVFYLRAAASDLSAQRYATGFLANLGLQLDGWYRSLLDGSALSSLSAMVVLSVSYVTHSFATTAALVDLPPEGKSVLFSHVAEILAKIGVMAYPDENWYLAGRFPSVPGALWQLGGPAAVLAGSLLLGAAAAAARAWTMLRPAQLLPLGVFVMMYAVLVLTPALLAVDFLSFPFIAVAFVLLALADRLLRRRRAARSRRVPTGTAAMIAVSNKRVARA